jgi:hypothetical protein
LVVFMLLLVLLLLLSLYYCHRRRTIKDSFQADRRVFFVRKGT